MIDNRDDYFDLVRVNALPVTPEGLREFATIMRESCAYDSNNMFHLSYQWNDKKHRHVGDMQDKIYQAADRIEQLEALLEQRDSFIVRKDLWPEFVAALEGKKDE